MYGAKLDEFHDGDGIATTSGRGNISVLNIKCDAAIENTPVWNY